MVAGMNDNTIDQDGIGGVVPEALPPLQRRHHHTRRVHRINARFSAEERAELDVAAGSIGMTATGFAAQAALNAARGAPLALSAAQDREALAVAAPAVRGADCGQPIRQQRQPGRGRVERHR